MSKIDRDTLALAGMSDVSLAPVSGEQRRLAAWYRYHPDKVVLFSDGVVGNSKTTTMVVGFFLWAMANFSNKTFGLLGKDKDTLERNVYYTDMWIYLNKLFGAYPGIRGGPHNEELYIGTNKFVKYSGNNRLCVGAIQGATLAGLYIDDATQVDQSCFEEALQRCRVPGYRIWISCNPASPMHYLHKLFIEEPPDNAVRIRLSNKANPFLPADYYTNLLKLLPPTVARRKVRGEWCADEGLIYSNFDVEQHVKQFSVPQTPQLETVYRIGIDVGYNHGTGFIMGALYYLRNKPQEYYLYIWHEYYYRPDDSGMLGVAKSPEQLLDDLYEHAMGIGFPLEQTKAFCDASAKHFIVAANKYSGYGQQKLKVYKAQNRVMDTQELSGISLLRDLFQSGRIGIHPSCTNLIQQIMGYRWKPNVVDQPFKQEASPEGDLACVDALRYMTNSLTQYFYKFRAATGDPAKVEQIYNKQIYGMKRSEDYA